MVTQPLPSALTADWELKVEPLDVVAIRQNQLKEIGVLIKWKGLPDFENSWEKAAAIIEQFPNFHLEDKVIIEKGGGGVLIENRVVGG